MLPNKKTYEAPEAQLFRLRAEEELLTVPSVSDTGYGWDDDGPITPVSRTRE
jgi:hypothetical protein